MKIKNTGNISLWVIIASLCKNGLIAINVWVNNAILRPNICSVMRYEKKTIPVAPKIEYILPVMNASWMIKSNEDNKMGQPTGALKSATFDPLPERISVPAL